MSASWTRANPLIVCAYLLTASYVWASDLLQDATADGHWPPIVKTWTQPTSAVRLSANHGSDGPTVDFLTVNSDPEGDMPREVEYTPDGTQILIVHRDTDNLTFFDTTTFQPTHTLAVGDFPVDVAITPSGQYAVVPNVFSNSVAIIDIPTHTLLGNVPITGDEPYRVAVTPDSAYAVVGVISGGTNSSFSIIDLAARSEILSFPSGSQGSIGFFFNPEIAVSGNIFTQFALTPDGTKIVLPDRGASRVVIYDRATGAELASLPSAALPTAVDVSTDGTIAVVSHESTNKTITKIDLTTLKIADTFATTQNLSDQAIRITPDKSHAIAAISNNVIFVNLTTGATTATISTGSVGNIEISYDGQYAFVSNFNARVIDIASQALIRTISYAACVEAATSPTALRAVALNNRFGANVHFYNINGAAGLLEDARTSGVPAEGDVPFAAAVATDGSLAVIGNNVSGNVAIVDLDADATIRSYVDCGVRIKELAITPDDKYAVVCAMDADRVAIVDLATDSVVKQLTITSRPGRVRISPDGQWAYVLNVAGTDYISFIRLDGPNSTIVKQVLAGQTGAANGPTFTETSGIELSADGTILAVCDSFNDLLRLYDTNTQTQVAQVPVGDFPLRVAFSPDGTRAYVTNHFSYDLSVVNVDGPNSSLIGTVPGMSEYPITVSVDAAGAYVYVGTRRGNGGLDGIRVVDTATLSIVKNITFPNGYPRDSQLHAAADKLLAFATDGALNVITAAGPSSTIDEIVPLDGGAPMFAFNPTVGLVVVPLTPVDAINLVSFVTVRKGDLNCDGKVDFGDINPFVLRLTDPSGYAQQFPGCPDANGDINSDGKIDFGDINPFVALLTGP